MAGGREEAVGTLRKIIAQARLSTLLFVKDRMTVLVLFVSVLTFFVLHGRLQPGSRGTFCHPDRAF